MITDLILIIPTHNRQNYLNRVSWYYSNFNIKVYICDSTPEQKFNIDQYENIEYLWCPEKTFYSKILHVLGITDAKFYALSPDDDFIKYETLIECYEAMSDDSSYSMGIGKQIFFNEHLEGNQFTTGVLLNRMQGVKFSGMIIVDTIRFWSNYQNILWSIFRKDTLKKSFQTLIEQQYNSQNFIEMTLGMTALSLGKIYISPNAFNFREIIKGDHWGKQEKFISIKNYFKYPSMKEDIKKLWKYKKNKAINRIGLCSYLLFNLKNISLFRNFFDSRILRKKMSEVYFDDLMHDRIEKAINI